MGLLLLWWSLGNAPRKRLCFSRSQEHQAEEGLLASWTLNSLEEKKKNDSPVQEDSQLDIRHKPDQRGV